MSLYRWVQRFTPLLIAAARRFFTTSLTAHGEPAEVITDRAPALAYVIDEMIPAAFCQHRAVPEQPVRGRSRTTQSTFAADARAQDEPHRQCCDPRARVHPEPSPRPLRTRNRRVAGGTAGCRIRRTRPGNLTGQHACSGFRTPVNRLMQQCSRSGHRRHDGPTTRHPAQNPDMGPRARDGQPRPHRSKSRAGHLLLRPPLALAARQQREHCES